MTEKSRMEQDMEVEWSESQCKPCLNNDKSGMSLCEKFGIKPYNYQWNKEECPLRKVNEK